MKKIIFGLGLWIISVTSFALQPLPADQAFALSAQHSATGIKLLWTIAPGYYLYREQIRIEPTMTEKFPPGIIKHDEILGRYEVYQEQLHLLLPIKNITTAINLIVHYQGCAASGFCYPPITKKLHWDLQTGVMLADVDSTNTVFSSEETAAKIAEAPQDQAVQLLASQQHLFILLGFFGFGLLLAFTPCVLPLLPILSGIIIGQGAALTTKKAFLLSLSYVVAMAIAYAVAGVIAGLAGSYVQAFLQNPWVLGIFSLVFVGLAFSLFGLFELQLPATWQEKLTQYSNQQSGGTYLGVAVMGALSTLIVSPCVTAPLIGALAYIGKTGDALFGGVVLFTMGLGFGVPLLIVGTLGGKLLPKAGQWMNRVKVFFGIVMLLMAGWLLLRIPAVENLIVTQLITPPVQVLEFKRVKNLQDLEQALLQAKQTHKPVMLDFYASWCVACKQMARTTFQDLRVQVALKDFILLQADVTANDAMDQALEKKFSVVAPPTIIFFTAHGAEKTTQRIVGEMNAEAFLKHLQGL